MRPFGICAEVVVTFTLHDLSKTVQLSAGIPQPYYINALLKGGLEEAVFMKWILNELMTANIDSQRIRCKENSIE